jgi:hypothetical protein
VRLVTDFCRTNVIDPKYWEVSPLTGKSSTKWLNPAQKPLPLLHCIMDVYTKGLAKATSIRVVDAFCGTGSGNVEKYILIYQF